MFDKLSTLCLVSLSVAVIAPAALGDQKASPPPPPPKPSSSSLVTVSQRQINVIIKSTNVRAGGLQTVILLPPKK